MDNIHLNSDEFGKRFIDLYQVLRNRVEFIGKNRNAISKLHKKSVIKRAIKQGASYLPFDYQDAYVNPLKNNLDLVIAQAGGLMPDLVGALFDHVYPHDDPNPYHSKNLSNQLKQFLAVLSNFYRSFCNLQVHRAFKFEVEEPWLPPLATFRARSTLNVPTPYYFPADEAKLLFGGKVGVVVLPSTYREHPLLWGALAHEMAHDLLRADRRFLPDVQKLVMELFAKDKTIVEKYFRKDKKVLDNTKKFLGQLWRHWIGEAGADILAICNMGPAFALLAAVYTAALNKELVPSILEELQEALAYAEFFEEFALKANLEKRIANLQERSKEMDNVPILRASPPDRGSMEEIDTHPPDILRLFTMIGAIEALEEEEELSDEVNAKQYIKWIKEVEKIGNTDKNGKLRDDKVTIKGFLQIGTDSWITVEEDQYDLPLEMMKESARQVGRLMVSEHLQRLKPYLQSMVVWNNEDEAVAIRVKKILCTKHEEMDSITNEGANDAQLLAGVTLAAFDYPDLYTNVNKRLAEALQRSFERDEVWGNSTTALAREWSPSS